MANPNGRKGSAFELSVMKWLRSRGVAAERLRLNGQHDEGDLVVVIAGATYILELKNRKKLDLPTFWDEAVTEAANYAKARALTVTPPAYVIIKRRNHGVEKSWVLQDLDTWLKERDGQ